MSLRAFKGYLFTSSFYKLILVLLVIGSIFGKIPLLAIVGAAIGIVIELLHITLFGAGCIDYVSENPEEYLLMNNKRQVKNKHRTIMEINLMFSMILYVSTLLYFGLHGKN